MIVATGPRLTIPVPQASAAAARRRLELVDVEKEHIRAVLESTAWRIRGDGGAADRLGLKPTTLETRMAKLGIDAAGIAAKVSLRGRARPSVASGMPCILCDTGGHASQRRARARRATCAQAYSFDGSKTRTAGATRRAGTRCYDAQYGAAQRRAESESARVAQDLLDALRFLSVAPGSNPAAWVLRVGGSRLDRALRRGVGTEADMRQRVLSTAFTSLLAIVEAAQEPHVQFDFVTTDARPRLRGRSARGR